MNNVSIYVAFLLLLFAYCLGLVY